MLVSYHQDAADAKAYCAAKIEITNENKRLVCQSFWYRTLNDPTVAWSFYYSLLTAVLVVLATITIFVTLRSVTGQRDEAQRLFIADQRPWLKIDADFDRKKTFSFSEDGTVTLYFDISVKNIGKTPAFDVGDPFVHSYKHDIIVDKNYLAHIAKLPPRKSWNLPFLEKRDILRASVRTDSFFQPSMTIHPQGEVVHRRKWAFISKEDADATWSTTPLSCIYIYFSIPYKSVFDGDLWYETTMVYVVNSGVFCSWGIPRNVSEVECVETLVEYSKENPGMREVVQRPYIDRIDGLCVIT